MDKSRAKQIASSPVMANVTYNGIPIYIDAVEDMSGTASIHPIDEPGKVQRIPVSSLVEH